MKGIITIKDYKIHCKVGVYPSEKRKKQQLLIDVEILLDLSSCMHNDAINETVDYTKIGACIEELSKKTHYHLIEKYALTLLETLFEKFARIKKLRVKVKKPSAFPNAQFASVELEKERT